MPRHDEKPVMGLRTNKDFITENAVQNIMSVPKKPVKNYVDTRRGDKHSLIPSGLEPVYLNKKVCDLLCILLSGKFISNLCNIVTDLLFCIEQQLLVASF